MNTDEELYEQPGEPRYYPTITQAIILSLRFLFYSVVIGFFIAIIPVKFNLRPDKNIKSLLFFVFYIATMLLSILIGFIKFQKNEDSKFRLKFNKVSPVAVAVGVCIILTMPVLTDPLNVLLPMSDAWKKIFTEMSDTNFFTIATAVVAAPILEEILFRGIILNGLLKNYSPQKAIIVSAAIFGVIHMNPWQAVPAFLIGLLIGWMYWKTNSIIPGMILHFVNNLFAVTLGLFFKDADTLKQLVSTPVYIILYVVCAAILFGGWVFLEKYFENNPASADEEPEFETTIEE